MSDALKSLKAQIEIQKQLKKSGLSTSKLNDMINKVNSQFTCDAECLDAREKQKLYSLHFCCFQFIRLFFSIFIHFCVDF